MSEYDFVDGFIERKQGGTFEGRLTVEGIDLSPIEGKYFKVDGKTCLWVKRKKILEYSDTTQTYTSRERKPAFESYLTKTVDNSTIAYKGEFMFMRIRFSVVGIWDIVLGKDRSRLNLFVERMPKSQQNIINGINERRKYNEVGRKN